MIVRSEIAQIPGVASVGGTATDPLSGSGLANFVARSDRVPDRQADFTPIAWRVITTDFFEAMGMEMKLGRSFVDQDGEDGTDPVVISERLATILWGGDDPVGEVLVWGDPDGSRVRVIGVVEDVRDVALSQEPLPMMYRPHHLIPWAVMTMVVRLNGDAAAVIASVRERINAVAPGLPVPDFRSLEDRVDQAVAQPRFDLQLVAAFALVGLAMAIVGIYGLTAFDVRRRFREIGIRLSLGAAPNGIRTMILQQRLRLTVMAVALGMVVAFAVTRLLASQLYEIAPSDPITWVSVLTVVIVASLAATYLPASRATRIDPREVLSGD